MLIIVTKWSQEPHGKARVGNSFIDSLESMELGEKVSSKSSEKLDGVR